MKNWSKSDYRLIALAAVVWSIIAFVWLTTAPIAVCSPCRLTKNAMKYLAKTIALLLLLSLAPFAKAQTSLTARSGFGNSSSFGGSISSPFNIGFANSGTMVAGDLVIGVTALGSAGTFISLTDSVGGNTYTCLGPYVATGTDQIYLCYSVISVGGTNPTFHFNSSGTFTYEMVAVNDFTGERTSPSPYDTSNGNSNAGGLSTAWTTNAINTGCTNEGVIGALASSTGTQTPTGAGGWTSFANSGGYDVAYQNFTSKQTALAFTATVSISVAYTGIIAGFCTATQPAPSVNMMPYISAVLDRFIPQFSSLGWKW